MKTYFFCARDVRDYLQVFPQAKTLKFPPDEFNPTAFMSIERIQNFLRDEIVGCHPNYIDALNAPIVGETGIDGLRLDFNFGLRLDVPRGNFRVKIGEVGGQTFLDAKFSDVRLVSVEKFFIRWTVEVFSGDEKIFAHEFDLDGQDVLIDSQSKALGDNLSMLPAVDELRRRHGCKVSLRVPEYLREFAAHVYPEINFVDTADGDYYATFSPNFIRSDVPINPIDGRDGNIGKIFGVTFGIENFTRKPTFKPTAPPVTTEPYVCIGVQASIPEKSWLYPHGWDVVVEWLKSLGYKVFCIDRDKVQRDDKFSVTAPEGAEDFTGDFSIMHRANMLYHAEFFVGLSSGLSWLADAVNCPVVMICGFSKDWFEFDTPWRVTNRLVCTGCLSDIRVGTFLKGVCARHDGTPREFECQKKISPRQVIDTIERLIVERNLIPPVMRTN
ncbi:MAG: autotransporter strand-loop-strand O-heptosyltransferase [Selenomonadaceae bacterium]|nr:autotransporter strand-loop-strand O-heptosyltransferase [Selenomonadaceae bacterium]